jgi:hypothetical protein
MENNQIATTNAGALTAQENNLTEIFNDFGKAITTDLVELTRGFLKIDALPIGQNLDFIFEGLTKIEEEEGERTAAYLRAANGGAYITTSTVLVNSLKQIKEPAPVRIVYQGKKQVGAKQYHDFKVFTVAGNFKP